MGAPSSQQEGEFLRRIASAPADGALALVYADWLMEQGDARGEWIAKAHHGAQPSSRQLNEWIERQGTQWLGPLAPHVHLGLCAWEKGFLRRVVFREGVTADAWAALAGAPQLLLVRDLTVETAVGAEVGPAVGFLRQGTLRNVARLAGRPALLTTLEAERLAFQPRSVGVMLDLLDDDPTALLEGGLFKQAREVRLIPVPFVQPVDATEFAEACGRLRALRRFERVELELRFGALESALAWLCAELPERCEAGWGLKYADVTFTRYRIGDGNWGLDIDVGAIEGPFSVKARLGVVASVVSQWPLSGLKDIDVRLPAEMKVEEGELEVLKVAARRLPFLNAFNVGRRRLLSAS